MKTLGFREDRDAKIIIGEYIDNLNSIDEVKFDNHYKKKLLEYLTNGVRIFAITLWMYDGDDRERSIGPYMIFTDSVWIWPSHLAYYIEHEDYRYLKADFLNSIEKNSFKIANISDETKKGATRFLEGILNVKKRGNKI